MLSHVPFPIRRRAVVLGLLSGAVMVCLSACGSASSTSSSASAAAGAAGSTGSTSSAYQARQNYAKCLRSHGVNVADPSANGGPLAGGGGAFRALRSNPNFAAANQACAKYRTRAFGFANLTPAQRAQFQQDLVKFAQCMRSHNIDIPDPTTSSSGGFGILRSIPASERGSPAFQTALTACSSALPFRRGGGAAGGAPGA